MAKAVRTPILQLIRQVVDDQRARDVSDHDLLQGFSDQRDEAAFCTLLRRHGPMVLEVCRSVLGNEANAEDTFQATFLILARKAASIRKTASVASWLHSVAYRTALKARAQSATRQKYEARAPARQISEPDDLTWREVRQVLHEELTGLPERYRVPLVMCYLEGKTQDKAAAQLGLANSTLKERLERGRVLLRARLVRRGLGPAAVLVATAWPSAAASACLPLTLVSSTIKAAGVSAAGQATAGVISAKVAALVEGVLKTMLLTKLKTATLVLLLAALSAAAIVVTAQTTVGPQVAAAEKVPQPAPAPAARDKAPNDDKDTDQKKIQGQWKLVDADDSDGLSKTEGFAKHTLVIEGDQMWKLRQGDKKEDQGTFKLASGKDPKQIDFKTGGKAKEGQDRVGIYNLDGNKLTICFSAVVPVEESRRPTDFTIKPGSGRVLLVYEREKPGAGLRQQVERELWYVAEVDEAGHAISLQSPGWSGSEKGLGLRAKTGTPADKIPAPPPEPDGLALWLAVAKNAEVVIDGRAGGLVDLRRGMQVSLRMDKDRPAVTRIEAVTPGLATLKGVDVKKRTITVTARGQDWTAPVADDATIAIDLIGGKVETRIADLKEGARVNVRLAVDGDKIVVKAVVVARE